MIFNLNKGVSLIEVIVCVAIFAILTMSVYGVFTAIIKGVAFYREKTAISSLANHYMEIVRNIPYSEIGTLEGNPHGDLADLPNPIELVVDGANYQVYYAVSYVDDPADGTAVGGNDFSPNDYKHVKLYVKNVSKNTTYSFLTNFAPKGLEGMESGGALYIKVFDAVGQPIPGATIHIVNSSLTPNIDLTRTSDENGNWVEVGLPESANSYNILVTKSGSVSYSFDKTYPVSLQNPNPAKPDATVLNGQVTQISFSIDKLSDLFFYTKSQTCQAISGVGLEVRGSKIIGTPNVLKFDNTYYSNSQGKVSLEDIEWDNYTPGLTGQDYMIYGSSPIQQVNILPATNQDFNIILGPKTQNSLLTIVKDASTGNAVEGAQVDLQVSEAPSAYTIIAQAGSNGTITPSGSVLVNNGSNKTFNIEPETGYIIQNVFVDGVSIGPVSNYTFEDVIGNHAIYASFTGSVLWLQGWQYRKKIIISNTNIDSDLVDFPVLVKITDDSGMSESLASGYDIRFTDSTGSELLKYQRESWSGGGGGAVTANFWVKIPLLTHQNPTVIYIYYGKTGATDGQDPANVWDANFEGVWHMSDNASNKTVIDSTGKNNGTAVANTSTKSVAGKANGALTFNGSNDYVNLGDNVGNFSLSDNFTISSWVNPALDSSNDVIYGNTWDGYGYMLRITSSNKARFVLSRSSSRYLGIDSSVLSSGWHYITGVWDGANPKIFIDGIENSQTPVAQGSVSSITTSEHTKIGLDTTGDHHYFKGPIDEVRVSNLARSAAWIKFEYHNIADSDNLTFIGRETETGTRVIAATAGANGTITPSGDVIVNSGEDQLFIITPDYGYHISDVLADGESVGAGGIYTFNNVTANHTISASFEATAFSGGYVATGYTNGSIWSQQDWSGGSGQENFTDPAKYYQDNGGVSASEIPNALRLQKLGESYLSSGILTSSAFDTGTELSSYTTLTWMPTSQNPATGIKFQVAVNNDNLTWNFTGPDGTDQSYYTVPGTTITGANNNRYIRYKVFLSTDDPSKTPALTSVNINYVSGCFTPGQVMFPGLAESRGYQATITKNGYQTQIITPITVDGYNILEVLLGH